MNQFLKYVSTKMILLILVASFHFSATAWEPSESNCRERNYGLIPVTQYKCSVDKSPCTASQVDEQCSPNEKGVCERIEDLTASDVREYERRRQECKDWKDEIKEREEREREEAKDEEQAQLDFAKKQAEQAEKAREEALKEQQKMMEQAKNECTSSYDQVLRQRERIESEVQRIQQKMDQIEDQITAQYASISKSEDQAREEILKLKQQERQVINRFKQEKIKADQAEKTGDRELQKTIEDIENNLFESSATLEDMADFKEQICSSRSSEYLKISVECYNQTLQQVTAEREELFKRIRTDRYEAATLNQLFAMDAKNIDQTFERRLNALHSRCFQEKTGEGLPHPGRSLTVQVPCDLQAFEKRAKTCLKKNNNHRMCPKTPNAQAIEQQALAQLRKVEKDRKKIERARKQALKDIERLKNENKENKEWMAKALADLEEELRLAKKDFEERHERAQNELLRVREQAENKILQLERDKIRLLASDPARHFEEQLITARVFCCNSVVSQQTAQQCSMLTRYEQDPARFQFAFARSLPALRSASGPSLRSTRDTASGTR